MTNRADAFINHSSIAVAPEADQDSRRRWRSPSNRCCLSAQGVALLTHLEKNGFGQVDVALSRGHLTLRGIPLPELARFVTVLAKVKLPRPEKPAGPD